MSASIACPKCSAAWPASPAELAALSDCPVCRQSVSVTAFPALLRAPVTVGAQPENLLIEGEASCFYHPAKRATIPCSSCGRFLCALCDVKIGERNLCPGCVETGRTKGKLTELEAGRTLWDSTALTLTLLPLVLCFYATILCAPAAIIVAIMGWRKPMSIVRRSKWRLWLAIIFGLLEIAGWIAFFVVLAMNT
jgi:hypothetical protein